MPDQAVAITGMAGRFPGAPDVRRFWENLRNGVESLRCYTGEELLTAGVAPEWIPAPAYVKARFALENTLDFDAAFFDVNPREAELTDPQFRIFLECCWEALESAAYVPGRRGELTGVFAGASWSTYLSRIQSADLLDFESCFRNDKDCLALWSAYRLNLTGPSLGIQSFCSTSLAAVHVACQSLLNGECDAALAGGVTVSFPEIRGYFYEPGGILSPDSHCRSFDAGANGTAFGDGAGVVVLRRLEDALAARDPVLAVIRGSAINNDGSQKSSFAAPGRRGQTEVVAQALASAAVDARSISYVEAHGTGTALGDPIEIEGLTRAFRASTRDRAFCAIGSVKTNVGHLDRASGICALIKTVLMLRERSVPPSLHFERPNPEIDFPATPFYVNTGLREWDRSGGPLRAGVSSLGIGGTNVHVILEEAPGREALPALNGPQLLTVSAKNPAALEVRCRDLAAFFEAHPNVDLADATYTLQCGRRHFTTRKAIFCGSAQDAARRLLEPGHAPGGGSDMEQAARRWLEGHDVAWAEFHPAARNKLELPAYPLERKRYEVAAPRPAPGRRAAKKSPEPALYAPTWQRLPTTGPAPEADYERWLIFPGGAAVAELLAAELRGRGSSVEFCASPNEAAAALRSLGSHARAHVVHCGAVRSSKGLNADLEDGFYSVLEFSQSLLGEAAAPVRFDVLGAGLSDVLGGETICPAFAAVRGLLPAVTQESGRQVVCRAIDFLPEPDANSIKRLAVLLAASVTYPLLAIRHGSVWRETFEPVLAEEPATPGGIRDGGVCVITGGFGNIGAALAASLHESAGARLALIGRTVRQNVVEALQARGAEVFAAACDVADEPAMRTVLRAAADRFGAIHGIFHAAGLPGEAVPVQQLSRAVCAQQFAAKIHGTLALARLAEEFHPDFCLLMSSMASVLGGLGLAAYASANAFMDQFAASLRTNTRWIAVNWDAWRLESGPAAAGTWGSAVTQYSLSPAQALRLLHSVTGNCALPRALAPAGDLNERLETWTRAGIQEAPAATAPDLTAIWKETLGVASFEPDDNFFELGGDSLAAMRLMSSLRGAFHINPSIRELLERPTFRALSRQVEAARAGAEALAPIPRLRREAASRD